MITFTSVIIGSVLLAVLAYQVTVLTWSRAALTSQSHPSSTANATSTTSSANAIPTTVPTINASPSTILPSALAPVVNPASVHGIDAGPPSLYPGIPWTRISYVSCGSSLSGGALRNTIQFNHLQGVRVLLLFCQRPGNLLALGPINDIAHSGADAIECGNEQMKHNAYDTYVPPDAFARFFDLCERTIHSSNPGVPVLLGSVDPLVGGIDYGPLQDRVSYLNEVQFAMNSSVHPGGNWSWRSQTIGIIDSWHNGFPSSAVNSLGALLSFWAGQFGGDLGHHIWVVEGTGCVSGCGIGGTYQISVAHILTLILDVLTARNYGVPFFYFSGEDFFQQGQGGFWPMGVLDGNGHPKGLRQDLGLGARALVLSCPGGSVRVIAQEPLLADLYRGCSPPGNYVGILAG
jgi:hypothetical protein